MKTHKLAKCGIHGLSFCNNKHDAPQCDECILVHHHKEPLYKFIKGVRYKQCPRCKEYKPLNEEYYKVKAQRYPSWCINCMREHHYDYHKKNNKTFMIGHKVNGKISYLQVDSLSKLIKHVRQYVETSTIIEIKRIK